ncbi:MAG: HPr family phosphocarrier protein [Ruminococcus sp.]|nr:HPr family phosphocarrier protein [Ruminococcus sp.]MCD7728257.1 HPr family phosphocarrier protein [Ruminococcus sp.]MCD7773227.1 HPr family phosphocarrier protein [Ruminococcus sp.]MCD8327861.1 HPr family phosphocarrier protein [Ruminococcus sp.]
MITKSYKIVNEQGLHMRPAGLVAAELGKFQSEVTIKFNGNDVNAKSIMNLMAACIKCGSEIEIIFNGSDEQQASEKFEELYANNFGD